MLWLLDFKENIRAHRRENRQGRPEKPNGHGKHPQAAHSPNYHRVTIL